MACHTSPTFIRSASRLWIATRFFLCDSSFACTRLSVPRLCYHKCPTVLSFKIVQESQPAVHRIRISASLGPTYPGQISFTLETLDIRPRGFPPLSRYSFRHSLFLALHSSLRYCFIAPAMLLYHTLRYPVLRCRVSAPDIFGAGPLD